MTSGDVGERRRDRGLPDPTLAGDPEELGGRARLDGAPRPAGSAPEADAPVAVGRAELDVGDLRGRDADVLATLVGRPTARRSRRRAPLRPWPSDFVTIGVVGELDVELAGGLGHSDAYVHGAHAIGRPSSVRLRMSARGRSPNGRVSTRDGGNRGVCVIDAISQRPAQAVMPMQRVAILVFDDVQSLDVSGPAEVLSTATLFLPTAQGYDVTIVSLRGGIGRHAERRLPRLPALDARSPTCPPGPDRHRDHRRRFRRPPRDPRSRGGGRRRRADRSLRRASSPCARVRCSPPPPAPSTAIASPRTGPERRRSPSTGPTVDVDADPIYIQQPAERRSSDARGSGRRPASPPGST